MPFPIVTPQDILTEVIAQIAPDRVDVIGLVLRIVVLHEKTRSHYPIVVRATPLLGTGPSETRRVDIGRQPRPFGACLLYTSDAADE